MDKLHAFCGPIYLDGWLNVDISIHHGTDLCADLLTVDFPENTFTAIYGCHGLEHLEYEKGVVEFLSRCHRWLKPGGILRLAVPDLELGAFGYTLKKDLNFLYGGDFKAYYYKDTLAERLNFFVKAWQHTICFDYELLSLLLADAGFTVIQKKQANESRIDGFNHDRFISESLYVEAIK